MDELIRFKSIVNCAPLFVCSHTSWRYVTAAVYDVPVMQLRNFMDRFPWGQNGINYIEQLKVATRL